LERIHPWDVDVAFLLTLFLREIERRGEVDFRASGVALDSSASIHLKKSKLLLKLEEPPEIVEPEPLMDFVPPPLALPLRYELTTTTIQHLIDALNEALMGERLLSIKPRAKPILPPPPEATSPINAYLIEIENLMENLHQRIKMIVGGKGIVTFSRLVKGMSLTERIKAFITLLFMAQKGKIDLWQDENQDEIYIILSGG